MSTTKSIHPLMNGFPHGSSQSSIETANRNSWASSNSSSATGSSNGKSASRFVHIKDLAARAGTHVDKHAPVCSAITWRDIESFLGVELISCLAIID